jgi:hypothetical protein
MVRYTDGLLLGWTTVKYRYVAQPALISILEYAVEINDDEVYI